MIFSGNNYLSLSYNTGISFNIDLSVNNDTGIVNFGFSGQNNSLNFKLEDNKFFDSEGRNIYLYRSNQDLNISGNISPANYSYYIDESLIALNAKKTNFTISGFYINASGCEVDSTISIFGTRPAYNLNLDKIFYITGTNILTGTISNTNNLNFKIYSGSITIPTGFSLGNVSEFIQNTGYFSINHYPFSSGQVEDERLYEVQLNLFTNFGQITQNFTTTGSYSGFVNVNLNLLNITDFIARTGINTGIGNFKENNFQLNYNIITGSIRSEPVILNKYLNVKLEYTGGNTGSLYYDIFATGYSQQTLSGFITGSGIIEKRITFSGTGYNAISGFNQSGLLTGIVKDTLFVTGFSFQNISINYSGLIDGVLLNYSESGKVSGNAVDGVINHFTYYYKNIYNDTIQISGSGTSASDLFGYSICSNTGNIIVVGNPGDDIGSYTNAGSIYIYTGINTGFTQVSFLTGNNILANDSFGSYLDINPQGTKIFVGASGKSVNSVANIGSVYIFTGNGVNVWSQQQMITGNNASGSDAFGASLEIADLDNILVIGAPYKNIGTGIGTFTGAGMAYIFTGNDSAFAQANFITGSDISGNYNFGNSLAISRDGTTIFVGSPNSMIGTSPKVGAVYIFSRISSTGWNQIAKITGNNLSANEKFGSSISINQDAKILSIGAIGHNSSGGAVYIFTGDGSSSWVQKQRISGSDGSSLDSFGNSIKTDLAGNKIYIGAKNNTHNGYTNAGSIYIFTGNGNVWAQEAKITGSLGQTSRYLGHIIDLGYSQKRIIAGMPYYDINSNSDIGSYKVINDVDISGFIGKVLCTGNSTLTSNYLATGNITGNIYRKTFFETFNLFTGYYLSGQFTGLVDFKGTGFKQGDTLYLHTGLIDSGTSDLYIRVQTKNYGDSYQMTGKLTISGYNLNNTKNNVLVEYITGEG